MSEQQENKFKRICFPVNEHGWVLLFQIFGHKTMIRSYSRIDKGRVPDETNQHRMFHIECEGGVKVKSKSVDISQFLED